MATQSFQELGIRLHSLKAKHAQKLIAIERALKRDGEHMRALWEEDWIPVEKNYVRAQNPAARADLIVQGHSQDFSNGTFEAITHHQ